MKKDAYYFSHDSNAKDDPKIMLLIEELGLEGYGIFWVLIEALRDQPNYIYPLRLLPALARRYNTTFAKMETVIKNYTLFAIVDDAFFYSESLTRRMSILDEKRKKYVEAGKMGGLKTKQKRLTQKNGSDATSNAISNALSDATSNEVAIKVNKRKDNITHSKELRESTCYSFIEFWDTYGKKIDKKKCEIIYAKINESDRQKIKDTIDLYIATHKEKKFRKYPQTYLNGRNWEDDISDIATSSVSPDTYKPRKLKRLED